MELITTTAALKAFCAACAERPFVAVDTEFMRETTYWPKLCLIQLAADGLEAVIDPLAKDLDLAAFFALMTNTAVVKVFHAARQDVEIILHLANVIPEPLFDTQVAAMVCGFGESVSYSQLVKKLAGADIDKGARFTDWARRPLHKNQISYALADVTHLCVVYRALDEQLREAGRIAWVADEMAILTDPATYRTEPDEAWERIKMRGRSQKALAVLMELAAWRERTAQKQDVPRAHVVRDEALIDIATQAPQTPDALGQLRSVNSGLAKSARGREILEAVARGLARDFSTLPKQPSGSHTSAEAHALVELLRVVLKAAAAAHDVAPKLIASNDEIERLARGERDLPPLKGWRGEVFGRDALALLSGEVALTTRGGTVVLVPVGQTRPKA